MNAHPQRQQGFTLIELMIVVAIIGILAATAIPSFRNYQFKAKRTESFSNLASLATAEHAYFAEHGQYIGVPVAEPGFSQGSVPGTTTRSYVEVDAAFSDLGWTPSGDIFYDYDAVTGSADNPGGSSPGCSCPTCLTLAAYGDVDGDGGIAVLLYVEPDELGATCGSGLFGLSAPIDINGNSQYGQVVPAIGVSDDY